MVIGCSASIESLDLEFNCYPGLKQLLEAATLSRITMKVPPGNYLVFYLVQCNSDITQNVPLFNKILLFGVDYECQIVHMFVRYNYLKII